MYVVHLVCVYAGLSALLAAPECSPQQDLVIDWCTSDLQTHCHRQLLLIDEGERELILQS